MQNWDGKSVFIWAYSFAKKKSDGFLLFLKAFSVKPVFESREVILCELRNWDGKSMFNWKLTK